ncbi:hypothetical protein MHL39_13480 [Roseomonas mucosa]|uniref:hypothetical protein n=1 Tax=Roseomonas mucosa TaxID=207340 RepID=UPI001EF64EF5|nr:hypothetical protein [Roseomonas mucosa]MCG7357647.1 hypothetical protein [Roseomonas mucosa]
MARLKFSDLLKVYRSTDFGGEGEEARLTIRSPEIVDFLARIEADDDAAADAGITLLDDLADAQIGATVRVRVEPPRAGLGVLAWTMDRLLNAPGARIEEPDSYFLVEAQFVRGDATPPDAVASYRRVLQMVSLFAEASSYLDRLRSELVFIKDTKVLIPVRFDAHDLSRIAVPAAERLLAQFQDDLHREQKLDILSETLVNFCRAQPAAKRFTFILNNLEGIADAVRDGYRMFASSFSYNKIRSDLENARIEYTTKIHKTIVDIQSQLLGIPVATVVVASQMKSATGCGDEFWTDVAVLAGAWIFVLLLVVALVNQWLTLGVINDEVTRQKKKLKGDYATISQQFTGIFQTLRNRIWWHRFGLAVVGIIALLGAAFATIAFNRLVSVSPVACITTKSVSTLGRNRKPTASPPSRSLFPDIVPIQALSCAVPRSELWVAEPHAVGLGGGEGGLGASGGSTDLFLGGEELDASLLQAEQEVSVARQAVELR